MMIAQVLIHHTGSDVGDLAALGQSVDDEGIKVLVVAHRYVNQEVFGAGDDKHSDGLGQRADPVTETVDDLPCGWPDPDGNERLYGPANLGQVHIEQGAADDASLSQAAGAVQRGRR